MDVDVDVDMGAWVSMVECLERRFGGQEGERGCLMDMEGRSSTAIR